MERFGVEPQVGAAVLMVIAAGSMMLIVLFTLLPVKMAAALLGAKRTSFAACAVALFFSLCIYAAGLIVPFIGPVVAFFLNGLAFSAALGTGYFRGLIISLMYGFFAALLAFGLGLLLISLGVLNRDAVGKKLEGEIVYSPPAIHSVYSSAA
jgi:hypothetical protein